MAQTTVGTPRAKPSPANDELPPGTIVGEYRIDRVIGVGGMGVVHMATQPLIGKRVAIKVVRRHLCSDALTLARFLDEARAVNRICHPNIVDIFSFGALPDQRPYFVMELLDGESLFGRLVRERLPATESIDILLPVCRALAAAHEKGIVHRDLKPDNIFLAHRGPEPRLVKLLDFGIAKLDSDVRRHTQEGCVLGTPVYLAPEVARGEAADWRSDVYSLGVVGFELFLGRPPFWAKSAVELMGLHISAKPAAPSSLWAEIPPTLERLLLQMLDKHPAARPSMHEIEATLSAVRVALQQPSEPSLPTVAMTARQRPRPRRRWWPVTALALGAAAALLALPMRKARLAPTAPTPVVATAPRPVVASTPAPIVARAPAPVVAAPPPSPAALAPSVAAAPSLPPKLPSSAVPPARRTRRIAHRHKSRNPDLGREDEALDPFVGHP